MLLLGVSGGMPPQENFEKIDALRLNLRAFQSQITVKHYYKIREIKFYENFQLYGN